MRNIGIIDEATLNAVKAALDERVARLELKAMNLQRRYNPNAVETEDSMRDLVWTNDAILEARRAQELFAEVRDEPEPQPETELRYAWGDR